MNLINLEEIFGEQTKYSKVYFKIVKNSLNENRVKLNKNNYNYVYYEKHHILPKSIYPEYKSFTNYPCNGVLLTAKEHFICHLLLMKHYKKLNLKTNYNKMSKAVFCLNNGGEYNSRTYQHLKLNLSISDETKKSISKTLTGVKKSEEHRKNITLNMIKRMNRPWKNPKVKEYSVYHKLPELYEIWVKIEEDNKCTNYTLAKHCEFKAYKLKSAIKYFNKHGNPLNDKDYLEFVYNFSKSSSHSSSND